MPNFNDRVLAAVQPELDEIRGLFAAVTEYRDPDPVSGGGSPIDPDCCEEVLKTVKEIKRKIDECCRNMEPEPQQHPRDDDWIKKIYDLIDQFKQFYKEFKRKTWEYEDEIEDFKRNLPDADKLRPQPNFAPDFIPEIPAPKSITPAVPVPNSPLLLTMASFDHRFGDVIDRLDELSDPVLVIRINQIYRDLQSLSVSMAECCSTMQTLIRNIDVSDKTDYTRIQGMVNQIDTSDKTDYGRIKGLIDQVDTSDKTDYTRIQSMVNQIDTSDKTDYGRIKGFVDQIDTSDKTDYDRVQGMLDNQTDSMESDLDNKIKLNVWRYS